MDECRECPDDAHCAGGLTAPYPSPGFWMVPDPTRVKGEKLETYRCQLGYQCLGGAEPVACVGGYDELHDGLCVNADGQPKQLEKAQKWCTRGFDVESPMCADEVSGYFYIDVLPIKCPAGLNQGIGP